MNGRPTFTESHPLVFADTTGLGRTASTLQVPTNFNASPTTKRPLVFVIPSRANAPLTVMSNDGISNMRDEMNTPDGVLVLPLSGRTGTSGINSFNGSLCCCASTVDLVASVVDAGTDQLTVTAHGFATGAGPLRIRGASLPAPLSVSTDYYVIAVDANNIKVATSAANALANTPVDLTTTGSGTITFAPNDAAYIAAPTIGLIDRIIAAGYPVDTRRVYIYAQGGGGTAPAFRTACDYSSSIAAVWDYAGAGPVSVDTTGGSDPTCSPTHRVSFFHLHGTSDASQEPYSGTVGSLNAGMPNKCPAAINSTPTPSTMDQLKAFNGCSGTLDLTTTGWDDLVTVGAGGNETDLYTQAGCTTSGALGDGTILFGSVNGEDHNFAGDAKNPNWKTRLYAFFLAHPRP